MWCKFDLPCRRSERHQTHPGPLRDLLRAPPPVDATVSPPPPTERAAAPTAVRSRGVTALADRLGTGPAGAVWQRVGFIAPLLALLAFQQIVYPAPMGIVLNGALVGGRIALIALGIALVYRANR